MVIHIAANLFYWLIKKQDLIVAMFTGRRRLPDAETEPVLSFAATWFGAAVAIAAGIIIWLIANLEGIVDRTAPDKEKPPALECSRRFPNSDEPDLLFFSPISIVAGLAN